MKFLTGLGVLGLVMYIAAIVAAVVGWIINIFAIIGAVNGPIDGVFVLRIVGLFIAPLGAIMGLFF